MSPEVEDPVDREAGYTPRRLHRSPRALEPSPRWSSVRAEARLLTPHLCPLGLSGKSTLSLEKFGQLHPLSSCRRFADCDTSPRPTGWHGVGSAALRHSSCGLKEHPERVCYTATAPAANLKSTLGRKRAPPWTIVSTPSNRLTDTNRRQASHAHRPWSEQLRNDAHMQTDRPRKLQRISQACDLCHRRSIRCRPSAEDTARCQNCYDFDVACTYDRPSKRRKHPAAPAAPHTPGQQPRPPQHSTSQSSSTGLPSLSDASGNVVGPSHGGVDLAGSREGKEGKDPTGAYLVMQDSQKETLSVAWKAFALSCETTIMELIDVYMEVVWPLYPLFDESTLKKRIQARDHLSDEGFFASVMAACALASARIRDGATTSYVSNNIQHAESSSEIFYTAAKDAIAKDFTKAQGIDCLRACALLALASIQYGQIGTMQQYLGQYFTLSSMQRFYDERFWPQGLDEAEIDVRRRIFWCVYTMDVYAAVVWNCFLRSQEIHANVKYPGVHTSQLSPGSRPEGDDGTGLWLVGWNFAVDLYRILEHVLNKVRAKRFHHEDRRCVDTLVFQDSFSDNDVMQTVLRLYYQLPAHFKETPPPTPGEHRPNLFAYQAANIQATLQLLRMILFSMEDGPGIERKCDVAGEVLSVFHSIPVPYLRAISKPLVYHLGTIGHILGSTMEGPVNDREYHRVRASLLSMADLLDMMEAGLQKSSGASQGLRSQVEKADEQMKNNRRAPQPIVMQPGQSGPSTSGQITGANPQGLVMFPNFQAGLQEFSMSQEMFGDWSLPFDFYQENSGYFPSAGPNV